MPEADYALGVCYERGYGVRKNAKLAIRWYQTAEGQVWEELLRLPDPAADRINAMMRDADQAAALEEFLQQETTEPSAEELKRLAHQGDAKAQHELAHRYAADMVWRRTGSWRPFGISGRRSRVMRPVCAIWRSIMEKSGSIGNPPGGTGSISKLSYECSSSAGSRHRTHEKGRQCYELI